MLVYFNLEQVWSLVDGRMCVLQSRNMS